MVSSCVHLFLLALCLLLATFMPFAASEVHYHDFIIQQTPVKRLCKTINSVTVNGQYPGPTLEVRNGDTLIINAVNRARSNITLHWHGVRQLRTGWADGPEYVTQCPIQPGGRYTYRFTITGQEGTLWWHAHSSWLRATVHGALIIYPKLGTSYPFPKPNRETTIILGEWWNANPVDVINQATRTGSPPNASNAYTINGQPGDLYRCSSKDTTVIPVAAGETILLRIVGAAMNQDLYFAIANHQLTVVGIDGSYTKPFTTNIMLIAPGQTHDVLLIANQPPGRYYIAAHVYESAQNAPFDNTTTTAILEYKSSPCPSSSPPSSKGVPASSKPLFPTLPFYNDSRPAAAFSAGLRSLYGNVPQNVDYSLFVTVGIGTFPCPPGQVCGGPNGNRLTASMNNVSLVLPSNNSILQAYVKGQPGVFTTDFPPVPPIQFDYTAPNISTALWTPVNGTKVFKVKYGSTVQMVWQDTNIVTGESHPMHLHGYDFYILAEGFGNFNPQTDTARFNLVDPPLRNTAAVPVSGWSVMRFKADNPGAWLMHCHYDTHIVWGLSMVLLVENGVGELESLEPPPPDLPQC